MNDETSVRHRRRASLGLVQVTVFVDLLGISLMIPVLPLLIGLFTTSKAAQAYWFVALGMTFGLMQFLCSPLLGALSDRFGRRPVLLIGIAGLCVSFLGGALAPTLGWLLASRVVSGATAANMSVAQAYAADITPPEARARAFGQLGATFGIAFVVGPVVGGVLGAVDLRLPFVLAAFLAFANFLYALMVLPESLPEDRRRPVELARCNPFAAIALLFRLRGVGALLIAIALTLLAQFTLQFSWVLYTNFRFGWDALANGVSLFVAGVSATLVQGLLLSRLLDRFGERRLVVLAIGSSFIASLLFGLVPVGWMLYLVIVGNFLANAGSPTLQAIVSKAADPKTQGQMMGALSGVGSAAIIVAPVCGPVLLAQVSDLPPSDWRVGAPFFLGATLQLLALVVSVVHFARHPLASSSEVEKSAHSLRADVLEDGSVPAQQTIVGENSVIPPSCKDTGRVVPVIDRNRCEAKADCVRVCPYGVFAISRLDESERASLSFLGRLKARFHGWEQAFAEHPDQCHACGLCVSACPEKAISLRAART